MREDLEFLYQKAMRSKDFEFIDEVFMILIDNDIIEKAENLNHRLECLLSFNDSPRQKFSFLIGDSQMRENWYRNRK